jgi:hypothetical protein
MQAKGQIRTFIVGRLTLDLWDMDEKGVLGRKKRGLLEDPLGMFSMPVSPGKGSEGGVR